MNLLDQQFLFVIKMKCSEYFEQNRIRSKETKMVSIFVCVKDVTVCLQHCPKLCIILDNCQMIASYLWPYTHHPHTFLDISFSILLFFFCSYYFQIDVNMDALQNEFIHIQARFTQKFGDKKKDPMKKMKKNVNFFSDQLIQIKTIYMRIDLIFNILISTECIRYIHPNTHTVPGAFWSMDFC